MRVVALLIASLLVLAGCAGSVDTRNATDAQIAAASYRDPGPAKVTLYTAVSNNTGSGAHSAMMISGSQRVLYDPAGSWYHPLAPERGDVHFGFTDFMRNFYLDFHSRETYHILVQEKEITVAQADAMIAAALEQGASPRAYCTQYVSRAMGRVPGFDSIRPTWFPLALSERFAELGGVTEFRVYDDDPNYNKTMLEAGIVPLTPEEYRELRNQRGGSVEIRRTT